MSVNIRCFSLLWGALVLLQVSACVETAMKFRGNPVSPVHVVALPEHTPVAGRWETFDLVIDYAAVRDGDLLEIKGQAVLGQHQQMLYDRVRFLVVYLFFVDEAGRVLESLDFVQNLNGRTEDVMRFSRFYKVPPGTTGISFGYSGKVMDWETVRPFYLLPMNRQ